MAEFGGNTPASSIGAGDFSVELGDSLLAQLAAAPAVPLPVTLEPGMVVNDTFEIKQRIGAGGMGVVYRARDVRLGRDVALKLHNGLQTQAGFDRLTREAQAMAQLAHPNVITVHEVGTFRDQLFIAVEYLGGGDAGTWLKAEHRSRQEIVQLFLQAGRGLAAAHAVGLVHRDFKPDNVLIADDGRVCVADFGLARPLGELAANQPRFASGSIEMRITPTGAAVGTPAYMAPEQYDGGELDARADQFSFCAALYEALTGQLPFLGKTPGEIRARMDAGPSPHSALRITRRFQRALLRGLRVNPDDRYASMSDLLRALAPPSRRRWFPVAVGAVLLVGGWFAIDGDSAPEVCTVEASQLAGTWDVGVNRAVHRAFQASGRSYADATFTRVASIMDTYANDWIAMREQACRATRVTGEQSDALLDRRMRCLDGRRATLRALTQTWVASRDPATVDNAVRAAMALPALEHCADGEALMAAVPPPEDENAKAAVAETRERLGAAHAMLLAGNYNAAGKDAKHVVDTAEELDYAPLLADALYLRGRLERENADYDAAEATFHRVIDVAIAGGNEARVADAWIQLLSIVSNVRVRVAEARALERPADLAIKRAGNRPLHRASLLEARAFTERIAGRYKQERLHLSEALAIRRSHHGADHLAIAKILHRLSFVAWHLGDYQVARRYGDEALAMKTRLVGDAHPETAKTLAILGLAYSDTEDTAKAIDMYKRAIAILETTHGPASPVLAPPLNNLVRSLRGKDPEQALRYARRMLQIDIKAHGRRHHYVAGSLDKVADVHRTMDNCEEAVPLYLEAVDIYKAAHGPKHTNVAWTTNDLARCYFRLRRYDKAVAGFEFALASRLAQDHNPRNVAETRFGLAQALWQQRRKQGRTQAKALATRATTLAHEALAYYRTAARKRDAADVIAWLRHVGLTVPPATSGSP